VLARSSDRGVTFVDAVPMPRGFVYTTAANAVRSLETNISGDRRLGSDAVVGKAIKTIRGLSFGRQVDRRPGPERVDPDDRTVGSEDARHLVGEEEDVDQHDHVD
jgi:hypothetical protein